MKTIREILTRTFFLFFRHSFSWACLASLFFIPFLMFQSAVGLIESNDEFNAIGLPQDVVVILWVMAYAFLGLLFFLFLVATELMIPDVIHKKRCSISEVYGRAWDLLPGYVLIKIKTLVRVLLGVVLLIVPGILRAMKYCFAGMIYLYEGKKDEEALTLSARRVEPVRGLFALFLVLLFSQTFLVGYLIKIFFDLLTLAALWCKWVWMVPVFDVIKEYFIGLLIVMLLIGGYYFYEWMKKQSEKS
jgi:hypothetical protein